MTARHAPLISIVIPTLNSEATLSQCLQAIRNQAYDPATYEIILVDGGSQDRTSAIGRQFQVDLWVDNHLKTGEAGKAAGIKEARGEFIALIDSDNIIDDTEWLSRMMVPFADQDIVASEPLVYSCRETDPALTRYFAMLGMSDPLCLFLGNYDRECMITGRWTGLDVPQEECGDYLKLTLSAAQLPTIGANGFVFRRSLLDHVNWAPYFFDIDIMYQAVAAGHQHVAKVKCESVHLYCNSLRDFYRKQNRRIRDFQFHAEQGHRVYPWSERQRLTSIARFGLSTLLVIPLLIQMLRGWRRRPDPAWVYHTPACWITLWVYGLNTIRNALGKKPEQASREGWQEGTQPPLREQ